MCKSFGVVSSFVIVGSFRYCNFLVGVYYKFCFKVRSFCKLKAILRLLKLFYGKFSNPLHKLCIVCVRFKYLEGEKLFSERLIFVENSVF